MRGRGYPIRTPVVDLVEIGAGGGSIAWIDAGGSLRVGPGSAGAEPGPACYGKGGTEPTVTDANLVLGRLAPDYFFGGELLLDVDAARAAIDRRCAKPLGLGLVETAYGIVQIANAAMANALRLVSVQRGHDPREFPLVAFGGAGPLYADWLAGELGLQSAIIPPSPGTLSAMALLVTDLKHEFSRSLISRLDLVHPEVVERALDDLDALGTAQLLTEGMTEQDIELLRSLDVRYVGQSYELNVPVGRGRFGAEVAAHLIAKFHEIHAQAYAFSASEEEVEMVYVRLTAVGKMKKPGLTKSPHGRSVTGGGAASAVKRARQVYFADAGGFAQCRVYDRYRPIAATTIDGSALIDEEDSTTLARPCSQARVDEFGNLHLRSQASRRA